MAAIVATEPKRATNYSRRCCHEALGPVLRRIRQPLSVGGNRTERVLKIR